MGNIYFSTKPRHVTPQKQSSWKDKHCSEVSTHIYGVSYEIDGKMFIFRVNLGIYMTPQNDRLEKTSPILRFQHTFIVFPRT